MLTLFHETSFTKNHWKYYVRNALFKLRFIFVLNKISLFHISFSSFYTEKRNWGKIFFILSRIEFNFTINFTLSALIDEKGWRSKDRSTRNTFVCDKKVLFLRLDSSASSPLAFSSSRRCFFSRARLIASINRDSIKWFRFGHGRLRGEFSFFFSSFSSFFTL